MYYTQITMLIIDMENREVRPKCVMKGWIQVSRKSYNRFQQEQRIGYQKTGDLLTLPYTEKDFIIQPVITKPENIQSVLIYEYVGKITLTLVVMNGLKQKLFPTLIVNVDGNFDIKVLDC